MEQAPDHRELIRNGTAHRRPAGGRTREDSTGRRGVLRLRRLPLMDHSLRPLAGRALAAAALLAALARLARAEFREIETADLSLTYPHPTLDYLAPYTARCFENSLRFH